MLENARIEDLSPIFAWSVPYSMIRRRQAGPRELAVDHTWVSTYDGDQDLASIESVIKRGHYFWYCWGVFYPCINGRLLQANGPISKAVCLVKPNVPSELDQRACGTIFRYGVHGVCHQLSNQVLYFADLEGMRPTVQDAAGYIASEFIYGTYGRNFNVWKLKRDTCAQDVIQSQTGVDEMADDNIGRYAQPVEMADDLFSKRARSVLRENPNLLDKLFELRRSSLRQSERIESSVHAKELNSENQVLLDEAAGLLGPRYFKAIFGFDPEMRVNLVVDLDEIAKFDKEVHFRHGKSPDLNDLFLHTLKDIYFAEKQIAKALPKMAKAATSDKLRAAFEKHQLETESQIERLEQVFELLEKPARGKTCDAIMGILDEGKEIMDEYKGTSALDAGLLAAAQAVEHYEISRYGTLKAWAIELGMKDAVRLLDATLQEEKNTDHAFARLAAGDSVAEAKIAS